MAITEARRIYNKTYYQEYRDRLLSVSRERHRREYAENPEKYRERSRNYRLKNAKEVKEIKNIKKILIEIKTDVAFIKGKMEG